MSMSDFPGKLVSVLFLGGCNFRCPYCHNRELVLSPDDFESIPFEMVSSYLACHNDFLDAVVVTGGEPTIHPWLDELLQALRDTGVPPRLDTNGSRPEVIERLIAGRKLNSIAMDVKAASEELYREITGTPVDFNSIKRSIEIVKMSGLPHTFRTTVIPGFHDASHLEEIAKMIEGGAEYNMTLYREKDVLEPGWARSFIKSAGETGEEENFLWLDRLAESFSIRYLPTKFIRVRR